MKHQDLTYKIRGCIYEVYKNLGAGFLENIYQEALLIELNEQGLKAEAQKPIKVHYRGKQIGSYIADILVEEKILLELKAVKALNKAHEAQILNYLTATGLEIGLLINFHHPKATIKRFIKSK